jgi:hypothetical protein
VFQAHERGYQLARATHNKATAARLAVQLGYDAYGFRGPADAQGWVERAALLVDGHPPSVASGTIALMRAHVALLVERDPEAAHELAERAPVEAHEAGAVDVEMQALALGGLARASLGEIRRWNARPRRRRRRGRRRDVGRRLDRNRLLLPR